MPQEDILLDFVDQLSEVLKQLTHRLDTLPFNASGLDSYEVTILQGREGERNIRVQLTPID